MSISPKKRINENLSNNWSFNDLIYNNYINYSFNKSGIKSFNNKKGLMSQKNKKLCFNNNISQIKANNSKNGSIIKKTKQNTESNLINAFNSVKTDNNSIVSNYNSYNNKGLNLKKNLFSLNNNYSFYNKCSLYIIDDENVNTNIKNYSIEKDFIKILNQKTNKYKKLFN